MLPGFQVEIIILNLQLSFIASKIAVVLYKKKDHRWCSIVYLAILSMKKQRTGSENIISVC